MPWLIETHLERNVSFIKWDWNCLQQDEANSVREWREQTLRGENEFYWRKLKIIFSHHALCVINTSTLPWTRQKAFPSTTCQSAVSPKPPNHSELRSPFPPPESSYNEPGWEEAGLSQDHRLLSATRSPLIRRHAPRDYKWKRILQIRCIVRSETIIGWGFYNIQNDQGRDRGYQPHPSASADNPYKDLDCSGYHKNRIL